MTLFSLKSAARELSLSECTMRRIVKRGEIPCRKIGKKQYFFTDGDLQAYIDACAIPAKAVQNAS